MCDTNARQWMLHAALAVSLFISAGYSSTPGLPDAAIAGPDVAMKDMGVEASLADQGVSDAPAIDAAYPQGPFVEARTSTGPIKTLTRSSA